MGAVECSSQMLLFH